MSFGLRQAGGFRDSETSAMPKRTTDLETGGIW